MRVPFARLWRFPSGSRGHASARWYLHCRYCWNLSRPDHLLSAVAPLYRTGRRTRNLVVVRRCGSAGKVDDDEAVADADRVRRDRQVRGEGQRAAAADVEARAVPRADDDT